MSANVRKLWQGEEYTSDGTELLVKSMELLAPLMQEFLVKGYQAKDIGTVLLDGIFALEEELVKDDSVSQNEGDSESIETTGMAQATAPGMLKSISIDVAKPNKPKR